jgi:acetyl-CoA C-acetyltransferase
MLYEIPAGFTFPGLYAAMAYAYLHRYKLDANVLAAVAVKNHKHADMNPKAHFPSIAKIMAQRKRKLAEKGISCDWRDEYEFLKDPRVNPPVASPLKLFDCCPVSDGAACVLLAASDIAKKFTDTPVEVLASAQTSAPPLYQRESLTSIPSARLAAHEAYEQAGVSAREMSLAEVHDCFTIAELLASEDLGFFGEGEGARAVLENETSIGGRLPINPSGGLKAKGHAIGATGVAQAVEVFLQLRGEAGKRQVADASYALTHNIGATGGACVVHIFGRS